ncbi:profilin [Ceratobasidium sp. AG-Ba]|nr:profilin [Ceratobasidium sp. AG-Ba]QRW07380.1 profilin [Ceratobasidium sp. AG-Ba]
MSWNPLAETFKTNSAINGVPCFDQIIIMDAAGNMWGASSGFTNLPDAERKAIPNLFKNPDSARAGGITINGKKYFVLQADENMIMGKKGGDGCVAMKTKGAIVVTTHVPPIQTPELVNKTEPVVQYLKEQGH